MDPLSRRLLANAGHQGPLVLMYHAISPGSATPASRWCVTYRRFLEQLDILADLGWQSVCARDLAKPDPPGPRTLVITFDDGYEDNLPAFELLEKRGLRASWFVLSDCLGGRADWEPGWQSGRPLLDAGQLREMAAAGMEIASHGRRHAHLPALPDGNLHSELVESRTRLAELLDRPVDSFAYPYGEYDERVRQAVAEAGYRVACTTRSGHALLDGDPLQVRRLTIEAGDDAARFARKLAFAANEVGARRVGRYLVGRLAARLGRKG
ncbi:polysaccharide deacetylase family protein [Thiohalobacter sp. IOR34]|uniref:polysaccharide deacetylase family protein n=1 Tax=Thiohalobacter sp. IOR34 TaxID=3057176 RepID=UPI0025AF9FC2|nr:polysaccharide deacetylase family protein [Thiohalobacter sp. IOR34]WJW74442.1 polysaccharide deacetylase family protein [Thiohalobacter sp. IOR34]